MQACAQSAIVLIQVVASKGAAEEDEVATAGSVASAAKGKLVSSMMKKYLAEAMVPMLLELRRALEAARHPLLGQLLATLASLLKEHKHEVRPQVYSVPLLFSYSKHGEVMGSRLITGLVRSSRAVSTLPCDDLLGSRLPGPCRCTTSWAGTSSSCRSCCTT